MAVATIFVVLSGVVLANNTRFGSVIVLQNLAHDIALTIRQAQIYGIAVRGSQGGNFDVAYGVHFCRAAEEGCEGDSYELYVDTDNDAMYDPGEAVQVNTISGGFRIANLCTTPAAGGAATCGLEKLNIAFRRPEPDACIQGTFEEDSPGSTYFECVSTVGVAEITLQSNRGDESSIIVRDTGQISVQ